jgi:hypothetical protein
MNILKNLFGGGGDGQSKDNGIYLYVQPLGCEEVVEVRINPSNDLSRNDDGTLFMIKTVRGTHRCFTPAEMTLYFNKDRALTNHEIKGGKLLDRDAYDAWQEQLAAKKQAIREQNAAVDAANAEQDATDET